MPPKTTMHKTCFLCTGKINTKENLSLQENTMNTLHIRLCQILELPTVLEKIDNNVKITYCDPCVQRISNIQLMLEELEQLEAKVIQEKYLIEAQLKECSRIAEKLKSSFGSEELEIRGQIVNELQSTTIKTMLDKIRKRKVGQKSGRPRPVVRIGKNVTIATSTTRNFTAKSSQMGDKPLNKKAKMEKEPEYESPSARSQNTNTKIQNNHSQLQPTRQPVRETNVDVTWTVTPYLKRSIPEESHEQSPSRRRWDFEIEECSQDDIDIDMNLVEDNADHDEEIESLEAEAEAQAIVGKNILPFEFGDNEEDDDSFDCDGDALNDLRYRNMNMKEDLNDNDEWNQWNGESKDQYVDEFEEDGNHEELGIGMENLEYEDEPEPEWMNSTREDQQTTQGDLSALAPKTGQVELQNRKMDKVKCEECGRVLGSYYTWKNHVLSIHRKQHKYRCPHCDYGTQKYGDLEKHLVIHSDVRNFFCQFCSASFKRDSSLRQHLKRHTANRDIPIQIEIN